MKNILYVGPYKQSDGWGGAAKDYLRSFSYACKKLGYNLKAKNIFLANNIDTDISDDIRDLESNISSCKYDTIIQKALPQAICPIYPYKNIALCVFEQRNLQHSSYIKQVFGRMDATLVPSNIEKITLEDCGLKKVYNISQPINCVEIDKAVGLGKKENTNFLNLNTKYKHHIKFGFIGSFISRKNIMNLIIAFNNEFSTNDKVVLVIKTDQMSKQQREMIVKNLETSLASQKYNRKLKDNIIIITDRMDQQSLFNLHSNIDVFVCASKGEAFCRPLAESIRTGSYPLAVEGTGAAELIDIDVGGIIIPSHLEYVEGNPLSTSLDHDCELEQWCEPTIIDIRKSLRQAYSSLANLTEKERIDLSNRLHNYASKFDIPSIGEKLCSLDIM